MQITWEIFCLKIRFRYFWKAETYSYLAGQKFRRIEFRIDTGTTDYKTRNQLQIFSTIKCIEVSEVTSAIHTSHPFITPWIWSVSVYLRFVIQTTLADL